MLCESRLTAFEKELQTRSIVTSFVLEEADCSLDLAASISKDHNSAIAVQYCNSSAPIAYVGLHCSPIIPR
jgi:methylaspartate ammonia-lyase